MPSAEQSALLTMTGIEKSFPGVRALRGVNLRLASGEVLALMGENGAGKSTLIKILGGAHQPDCGEILIDGEQADLTSPVRAMAAGVGVIYQEFNLVPALSAWENIFLGREKGRFFVDQREEKRRAQALFERLSARIPQDVPVGRLSVAQQQLVEIAKALSQQARLLVMDEPSAALTPQETESLFGVIEDLKADGIGIIYISHRLEEIERVADRVTVLRDGVHVGDRLVREVSRSDLIELMVGRSIHV
ncbi:MAG: ATP-binding cassette domain-containing protein [Planctomycetaceae bacterium]|nr:ATP-binding cassette domain-containing protein [Planctomycetaceae bacterium]